MPNRHAHITITHHQNADSPTGRRNDLDCIRTILTATGWDERYIAAFEAAAQAYAGREDAAVYLARLDDNVVGFAFVELHGWNRLAQLQGLAVAPSARRQGVASALVSHAEGWARAHGARGIYVDTPVDSERGRLFYEARGYQLGYTMPRYYGDAQDGVAYQKFWN